MRGGLNSRGEVNPPQMNATTIRAAPQCRPFTGADRGAQRAEQHAPCDARVAVRENPGPRLKRPTRLPIPRVDMSETTSQQLVVFSLGAEEYALPIAAVHEIIRFSEPRSVASEVAWIRGVIGLRGKIIPIFDLAARLELAATGSEPGKIVILETGGGQVGVMVDEVEEVLTVGSDQLEPGPTASTDTIEAIAKIDDRLVILLNPEGLFAATPAADELPVAA
jgi:purine-binding chemotaxis protein CheW